MWGVSTEGLWTPWQRCRFTNATYGSLSPCWKSQSKLERAIGPLPVHLVTLIIRLPATTWILLCSYLEPLAFKLCTMTEALQYFPSNFLVTQCIPITSRLHDLPARYGRYSDFLFCIGYSRLPEPLISSPLCSLLSFLGSLVLCSV
jgi:hypothetical protein